MTLPRPVILGLKGLEMTLEEKDLFQRLQPLGFILFKRNCHSPDQVKELIASLKETSTHSCVPILIDQEGGRVQRLTPPHWRHYPSMAVYGDVAEDDVELAQRLVHMHYTLLGTELAELGINVNCAPVLDIRFPGAHSVIGDRAFSDQVETTAFLATQAIDSLVKTGILPIVKHLPGHGRSFEDSHEKLPLIDASIEDLTDTDFEIFRQTLQESSQNPSWGMTGHLIFSALDKQNPATLSPKIIQEIIRNLIGFKGILLTDCLTMKALNGSFSKRGVNALKAGCDLVLHCSGHMEEMIELCGALHPVKESVYEAIEADFSRLSALKDPSMEHPDLLWREFLDLIEPYWLDQLDNTSSTLS